MLEKRKIDRELEENEDWFRDRQGRQAAAEAAERQRTEVKQAEQRRLLWVQQWTQYALNSLPYDARREVEMEVHTMVQEALSGLQPSQPAAITQRLVDAGRASGTGAVDPETGDRTRPPSGCEQTVVEHSIRFRARGVETSRMGRSGRSLSVRCARRRATTSWRRPQCRRYSR
jgi:hypothetical protein